MWRYCYGTTASVPTDRNIPTSRTTEEFSGPATSSARKTVSMEFDDSCPWHARTANK